jgi:hypothetical protein
VKRLPLALLLVTGWAGWAQSPSASAPSHFTSASGQFTVQAGPDWKPSPAVWGTAEDPDVVQLTPTLLTVSAERLRQHLQRELEDRSNWSGRVLLELEPARVPRDTLRVVAELQSGRWQYRVTLPERMRRAGYLRALIEINLLEMANSRSAGRCAEVPTWLIEGLTGHLLASQAWQLILEPPQMTIRGVNLSPYYVESVNWQPLRLAHAQLQTNAPLTIEELGWPTEAGLEGRAGLVYRHCAQLLVTQLFRLPQGRRQLLAFIHTLATHYNWQVSFLEAFRADFPSLRSLEKWWALQVAHFTGRELDSICTHEDSVARLRDAVRVPVQVRLQTNDAPMHSTVSLQTVITEWDAARQAEALQQTLNRLALLRARLAPDLLSLLDDYRLSLGDYLRDRTKVGLHLPKGADRNIPLMQARGRVLRQLDQLDRELDSALLARPTPPPPGNEAASTGLIPR